jgi:hypothetical protein
MGLFKTPAAPAPMTPTPSPTSTAASSIVQGAQDTSKMNAAAAAGASSTLLTSAMGLSQTNTSAPKTLLGG